jgi:hypothetical protein
MKKYLLGAALALLVVSAAHAQTTYQASNVPFTCNAATAANVPLSRGMFFCRGVYFENKTIELFFGSQFELFTTAWTVGPYTATQSLTEFTQPSPVSCPIKMPGYVTGCPAGTVPGTLSFNWSGTDTNGAQHNGSVSATWTNVQYCGGTRCWYHPVLGTVSLTVN